MFVIEGTTIWLTRGDTFRTRIGINYRAAEGEPAEPYTPQPGDRLRFALKKHYDDANPLINKQIPMDTLILELEPEDTKDLDYGKYVYDIELTFAGGDIDTIIGKEPDQDARFILMQEVL